MKESSREKINSGLRNYEWVAVFALLVFMGVLTKIALRAPETRWPQRSSEGTVQVGGVIVVSISGAIEKPGLYHFKEGMSLGEALKTVKLTPDAEIEKLALDRPLKRGQRIKVPAKKKNIKKALR